MPKKTPKYKSAAVVTIHDAPNMSKRGKSQIAYWLRRQADMLEREGHNLAKRFTARYQYPAR
jgi:hypothetical protein